MSHTHLHGARKQDLRTPSGNHAAYPLLTINQRIHEVRSKNA